MVVKPDRRAADDDLSVAPGSDERSVLWIAFAVIAEENKLAFPISVKRLIERTLRIQPDDEMIVLRRGEGSVVPHQQQLAIGLQHARCRRVRGRYRGRDHAISAAVG